MFTNEEKKNICSEVKTLIKTGKSVNEAKKIIANKYDISEKIITVWDLDYRMFTSKDKSGFPDEEMQMICLEVKNLIDKNYSIETAKSIVADRYHITPYTIDKWNEEIRTFAKNSINNLIQNSANILPLLDLAKRIKMEKSDSFGDVLDALISELKQISTTKSLQKSSDKKQMICREVKNLVDSKKSVREAVELVSREYGVSVNSIYNWNKRYRIFSSNDKKMYLEEEKRNICFEVKRLIDIEISEKEAIAIISRKYQIEAREIINWDKKYRIFSYNKTDKNNLLMMELGYERNR